MKTNLWKWITPIVLPFAATELSAKEYPQEYALLEVHSPNKSLLNDSAAFTPALPATVKADKTIILLQPAVQKFVVVYLKEHRSLLQQLKENNNATLTVIENILYKNGIPLELKYLAVVESKLKNKATSQVGAAGVWQLMPVTARALGLKVSGKTDERRNIYRSSSAAARYLNTLYDEFDDWLLVIAAYNCGAGNVHKAIKKAGSTDFWRLQYFLPLETRNHVKRFIATHFYFEQEGSYVTVTKKERLQHQSLMKKLLNDTTKNSNSLINIDQNNCVNWVTVSYEYNRLIVIPRK